MKRRSKNFRKDRKLRNFAILTCENFIFRINFIGDKTFENPQRTLSFMRNKSRECELVFCYFDYFKIFNFVCKKTIKMEMEMSRCKINISKKLSFELLFI